MFSRKEVQCEDEDEKMKTHEDNSTNVVNIHLAEFMHIESSYRELFQNLKLKII